MIFYLGKIMTYMKKKKPKLQAQTHKRETQVLKPVMLVTLAAAKMMMLSTLIIRMWSKGSYMFSGLARVGTSVFIVTQ